MEGALRTEFPLVEASVVKGGTIIAYPTPAASPCVLLMTLST